MPSFGATISEKRKEVGLSQKELAARIIKEDGICHPAPEETIVRAYQAFRKVIENEDK